MLRIISGEWGSRRIQTPPGTGTRPTSERAREGLFSSLALQGGENVLDLFAGSGALGIESLSRGADKAVFCDQNSRAAACIRVNIASLGAESRCRVIEADWRVACGNLAREGADFDVVFVDPPWAQTAEVGEQLLSELSPLLAPGATVVIESASAEPMELSLPLLREKRYGDTLIGFYESQ